MAEAVPQHQHVCLPDVMQQAGSEPHERTERVFNGDSSAYLRKVMLDMFSHRSSKTEVRSARDLALHGGSLSLLMKDALKHEEKKC